MRTDPTLEDRRHQGMKLLVASVIAQAAEDYRALNETGVINGDRIAPEWIVEKRVRHKRRDTASMGEGQVKLYLRRRVMGYQTPNAINELIRFFQGPSQISEWLHAIGLNAISPGRIAAAAREIHKHRSVRHLGCWH